MLCMVQNPNINGGLINIKNGLVNKGWTEPNIVVFDYFSQNMNLTKSGKLLKMAFMDA